MNANGNPGEWALAGAKEKKRSSKPLSSATQKPERQHRLIIRDADGSTEGADPFQIPIADLNVARHFPGPVLAIIRAKCVDCSGGSPAEVRKCTCIGCPLWPYRVGRSPFRAGRKASGKPFPAKTLAKTAAQFEPDQDLAAEMQTIVDRRRSRRGIRSIIGDGAREEGK